MFFLFSLWLCAEYIVLGPFSYIHQADNAGNTVSRASSLWDVFFSGGTARWYPLLAGGLDRAANAVFYPKGYGVPFAVFPEWLAYGALLLLTVYVGGLFMYLLCSQILLLDQKASLVAGFAFAYTLALLNNLPAALGLAMLPLVIYVLERLFAIPEMDTKKTIGIIALGILLGISSSFVLTLPLALLAVLVWFLFSLQRTSHGTFGPLLLFVLAAAAVHIREAWNFVSNFTFLQNGSAGTAGNTDYALFLYQIVSGNWLAFMVIAVGLVFLKMRNHLFIRLAVITVALAVLAPLLLLLNDAFGHYVGFTRNFRFDALYLLVPFFAIMATASVLHFVTGVVHFENDIYMKRRSVLVKSVASALIFMVLFSMSVVVKTTKANAWIHQGSYIANTKSPDLNALRPENFPEDAPPFRVATIANEGLGLLPTIASHYSLESVDGYVNAASERYAEFFAVMSNNPAAADSNLFLLHAPRSGAENRFVNLSNFLNYTLISLANVKYVISSSPIEIPGLVLVRTSSSENFQEWDTMSSKEKVMHKLKENFTGRQLLIYKNENAMPRFFLSKEARIFENKDFLLSAMSWMSLSIVRDEVFLNKEDIRSMELPSFYGEENEVKVINYSADEIELAASSNGPSLLVITNAYSPYWKAYVNGKTEKIIPAYHAFMAVVLTENESNIVLKYEPPEF